MLSQLRAATVLFVLLTLLTGAAYPALITVLAQAAFPHEVAGSLIRRDGAVVGSELIGQHFDDARYFWGRPSATVPTPYNAGSSTGSNLGPTNPDHLKAVAERIAAMKQAHPDQPGAVPVELVTNSASGLDPHISPAAAEYQAARVARKRGISLDEIRKAIGTHTEPRALGILGEPRVNVLKLNLALEDLAKK